MSEKIPLLAFIYNRYGKATSEREASVELRITYERRQKYISTGIRLLPKQWRNGMVVNRVDAIQLNQMLQHLLVEVQKVILEMSKEYRMDIFSIPERLKRLRAGGITFLDFCQKRAQIRSYKKSADSKDRYERFIRKFIEWGEIENWCDITEENIIAFDKYLDEKGFKPYSKWNNYHRFLNSFIIDAVNAGKLTKNPYKWIHIDKEKSKTGIAKHLSPEEFQRICNVELSTESLNRVRDLFVFQTYTCMAYADMAAFDSSKIQEVKGMQVYKGQRVKGHNVYGEFTIPLLPPALKILQKYNYRLPIISNQKYNDFLKVVAQFAGIDKPLSSHWARHTGATLYLNEGKFGMGIIAKMCGHSSTRITEQVYAPTLDETVVDAMAEYMKNNY